MMKRKQPIDKLYCERLATLARFDRENRGEIEFSEYAIFPYESSRGLRRVKADELVFSCFDDEEVDGEGTNNGENSIMSEEIKSEMEAFSGAIDWEENYYEESYRDDFKKLFADFMI